MIMCIDEAWGQVSTLCVNDFRIRTYAWTSVANQGNPSPATAMSKLQVSLLYTRSKFTAPYDQVSRMFAQGDLDQVLPLGAPQL